MMYITVYNMVSFKLAVKKLPVCDHDHIQAGLRDDIFITEDINREAVMNIINNLFPGSVNKSGLAKSSVNQAVPKPESITDPIDTVTLSQAGRRICSRSSDVVKLEKDLNLIFNSKNYQGTKKAIYVDGTDNNDRIFISQINKGADKDALVVSINGKRKKYSPEQSQRLIFCGGKGNDLIQAHKSVTYDLRIAGGDGDDVIIGGSGNDMIYGGDGDDDIFGGDGDDKLFGGKNNDKIFGENGMDYIEGGFGNDILYGGDGNDVIYGLDGDDRLYGDGGNDYLDGGPLCGYAANI